MKASNAHLRNSCDTWLLPTMVLASFGLFIAVGLASFGFLSKAQATNTPPPDPALTGHFGRMFHLPPFAPPTNAVRDALMDLGRPGGIMDANDDLAAGPVALITDPNLSLINRNNPTDTAGVTFLGQFIDHALAANTTGGNNTGLGSNALSRNLIGSNNVALGSDAGGQVTTASNVICIGRNVGGANVDNSCFIGNIRNAIVAPDAAPVLVDSSGKLGTTNGSARRLKSGIQPMESASETILSLKPVTFHYKGDNTNARQFGLIVEQVADVNPDLVVRDKDGELTTVRYDAVNAMLLNEFLKEHRKGEEQDVAISQLESTLAQQQKRFQAKLARQEQQIADLVADFQRLVADIEPNRSQSPTLAEK